MLTRPCSSITQAARSAVAGLATLALAVPLLIAPTAPALADDAAPAAITACLTAFGEHPFGSNPEFRTLPVKVKVFGIGKDTIDDTVTSAPELIYVRTGVNVAGGSVVQLNNPNGWYCMRSSVNVMGGLVIRLACDAKFAMLGEGATVLGGSDEENMGTTVMGGTKVERDCA